jgi:DNA repair photolyase
MVIYEEKEFKTILNRMKVIDAWFWCRYTLNPYNGCEHACIYCDARSDRYYLQKDFDETIYVKINGPALLEHQLKHSRTMEPDMVAIGGTCDAYQPAEEKYQITRQILEILLKYHYPMCLSTKSARVTHDADILEQIGIDTGCGVAFTITTTNFDLASFLEPRASPPQERYDAIRILKATAPHIKVGVNFMPIIPILEDSDEDMEEVIKQSVESGADYILFAVGVTLRDNQANYFLNKLKEQRSEIFEEFFNRFGPAKKPDEVYYRKKTRKLINLCDKYKIPYRIDRWIPKDYRKVNYEIAQYLLNKAELNKILGKTFTKWFWAGQNIQNLKESIVDIALRNQLESIRSLTPEIIAEITPFIQNNRKKTNSLDNFISN